ncbi:hypothetical protein ACPCAG_31290 [Streptomyces pseudogriseolus]|uniref:hypothetical protein n=1 Tax=Streptomyces pseudogriseolus TaxID=36817 RepID=UPI003FA31BC0
MRAEDIRLSYTNPITGVTVARDWGKRFTEIDGVVLLVEHHYRSRGDLWSAGLFTDHLEVMPMVEWAQSGGLLTFAHVRRQQLLAQIANAVGTDEWKTKRDRWLALPRKRGWAGTWRIVCRGPRDWWALPNDPGRDAERGPWPSERAARAELGDAAVRSTRHP